MNGTVQIKDCTVSASLIIKLAKLVHTAVFTQRLASLTNGSAVKHQSVTEVVAFLRRKKVTQSKFNFFLVFEFVQTEPASNADTVCVHHNGRLVKNIAAY